MSPILLQRMITVEKISGLIAKKLDSNLFLVDLQVSPDNSIYVEVDSFEGISLDQCVEIHRYIENHLNRDEEDFSLKVSSPGLDQPFKVNQQYRKNIGRELEVVSRDGREFKGILLDAGEKTIQIESEVKESVVGQKKNQRVKEIFTIDFDNIFKARVVISFK